MGCTFYIIFKKSLLSSSSQRFLPLFSFKNFIISDCTFSSMMRCKLIICSIRQKSKVLLLLFWQMNYLVIQEHLLERLFLLNCILHFCQKSVDHVLYGCISGHFHSIPLDLYDCNFILKNSFGSSRSIVFTYKFLNLLIYFYKYYWDFGWDWVELQIK